MTGPREDWGSAQPGCPVDSHTPQFWQVVNLRRDKAFLDVEGTAMSGIKRDKTLEDPRAASGSERPNKPSHRRNTDEQPTGTPTSDRHGTETVHHWEDEHKS
jgi:hypothetical protein